LGKFVRNFGLNATSTGASGANHCGYVFGACAIRWAMNVPQPAVLKTSTTGRSNQHNLCRITLLA
jgi:hypothetical protein